MPAPNPRDGESQPEYLGRCIPFFIGEGRDKKQAVAICSAVWNRSQRKDSEGVIENSTERPLGFPEL